MGLTMAVAACVATASRALYMSTSTALTAVILFVLLDSFADIDNTQTRIAGTFHLSYSGHSGLLTGINVS